MFGPASLGNGAVEASAVVPLVAWRGSDNRKGSKAAALHEFAGYPRMYLIVNFVAWAFEQTHFPTPEAIQTRFRCSRATAYRLRRALADAYGIEPPEFDRATNTYEAAA